MTKVDDDIEERLNNAEKKEKPNPFAGFNGGRSPTLRPVAAKSKKLRQQSRSSLSLRSRRSISLPIRHIG